MERNSFFFLSNFAVAWSNGCVFSRASNRICTNERSNLIKLKKNYNKSQKAWNFITFSKNDANLNINEKKQCFFGEGAPIHTAIILHYFHSEFLITSRIPVCSIKSKKKKKNKRKKKIDIRSIECSQYYGVQSSRNVSTTNLKRSIWYLKY